MALDLPKFHDVDGDDYLTAGVYEFTLFPIIQILGGLTYLHGDRYTTPTYKAGYYGVYDPTAIVRKEDFKGRWNRYLILMTESFTDLFYLLEFWQP